MGRPEDERVKIPALLHLTRLGYRYLSLQECEHDEETNIFPSVFRDAVARINGQAVSEEKVAYIIREIRNALDNDDLGREFFKLLQTGCSGLKLVDFERPDQNSWHVVTELPCIRDQDEFRPDITLLGIPFSFKALVATPIARACSAPVNFLLNKNFVFQTKKAPGAVGRYIILAVCALAVTTFVFGFLDHYVNTAFLHILLKIVIDVAMYVINYRIQKAWVFPAEKVKGE